MPAAFEPLRTWLDAQPGRRYRNLSSLLNVLRHELVLSEARIITALSAGHGHDLKRLQDELARYLRRHDFAASSVATYRSRLKQLAEAYQTHIESTPPGADAPLGQRLLYYARKRWPGESQRQLLERLSAASAIPVPTLKRWTQKASAPRSQHHAALNELAQLLDADPDTLLAPPSPGDQLLQRAEDAGRDLRDPLPPAPERPSHFQRQLDDLLLFKTKARTPPLHQASFKLSRRHAVALQGGGRWTSTPDGEVASATAFLHQLDRYLRWACATHGLPDDQLDLSLLCVVELLEGYVDDCLTHELFGTLKAFLTPLAGLCDPDTGYLTRYHAPRRSVTLEDGHPTETFTTLADWQEHARYLHQQIKAWLKDVRHLHREATMDESGIGRRHIAWLLDRPDAGLAESVADLRRLIDDLAVHARQRRGTAALAPLQVAAWLAMSLEVPLRVSNWCAVEWRDAPPTRRDTAPCVWWDAEQEAYRLRVPRGWLKNRRGREVEQIATQFRHPQVTTLLAALRRLRATLDWETPYLLAQTRASRERAAGGAYTRTALAKAIQTWTGKLARRRWPDRGIEQGINPHALRHFVASYVLEQTGDFRLAATALMDSVAVVMAVYGKNDHAANQRRLKEMQLV